MPDQNLRTWAVKAAERSYAPYSHVRVGAALVAEDHHIYTGCNIENASYGATVCAERVALLNMASAGGRRFFSMYIYTNNRWPPCGICLQMMNEFATKDSIITLGGAGGEEQTWPFSELLPLNFGPGHLFETQKKGTP